MKTLMALILGIVIGVVCYRFLSKPEPTHSPAEIAYVLPQTLPVLNTTAIIHTVVATLHAGQPVEVTERIGDWAHLALSDRRDGWVKQQNLLDAKTYAQAEELLKRVETMQAQAAGYAITEVNLHLEPSAAAPVLAKFPDRQPLQVYGRRLASQPAPQGASSAAGARAIWYLVEGGGRAGWMLGRFVNLDIPPGLANYAEGVNMVAWLVLDSVNDNGHPMPQYLVADRIGTREFDFNHIRVFTWWIKRHKYVTAYVESGLQGYFPITVTHDGSVPYFRLRLLDDTGHKVQKVYGLFDTIVRPAGTVDGWNSDAMPQPRHLRRRAGKSGAARPGEPAQHERTGSFRKSAERLP